MIVGSHLQFPMTVRSSVDRDCSGGEAAFLIVGSHLQFPMTVRSSVDLDRRSDSISEFRDSQLGEARNITIEIAYVKFYRSRQIKV
jgi:hypothetical protein